MEYDNNNTGALFKNNKKNPNDPEDKKPDYTGQGEINHIPVWISAWVRTAKKDGSKFFSMKFEDNEKANPKPKEPEMKVYRGNEDIPF